MADSKTPKPASKAKAASPKEDRMEKLEKRLKVLVDLAERNGWSLPKGV